MPYRPYRTYRSYRFYDPYRPYIAPTTTSFEHSARSVYTDTLKNRLF